MAATTSTITFDFTKTNPVKKWQFNPNGADSYFFSDNQISDPTAQTVADGSLFKVSRSDDQYSGLTEGNGAYIYTVASINELLGISSQDKFVQNIAIVPYFKTKINYSDMATEQDSFEPFIQGRWISTKLGYSRMYRGRIKFINWGNQFTITGPPGTTNNLNPTYNDYITGVPGYSFSDTVDTGQYGISSDAGLYAGSSDFFSVNGQTYTAGSTSAIPNALYFATGGVGGQYKYLNFTPGTNRELTSSPYGLYWDSPLLTSEVVRFEIPFAITIPLFQHVYTAWPWNKSRRTLTTDLIFTKIEIRVTYDTINEYKTKFFSALDITAGNNFSSSTVYLDKDKTRPVPQGYLATAGKYFVVNSSGGLTAKRVCQTKILVSTSADGTVSSGYPTAATGYGDYNFNPDVSYITLDAGPNYPIVFASWEATDFDGNVTTISYDSTINVYNGLYASIKPIFTASTPGPSPSPTPGPTPGGSCNQYMTTYAGTYTYTNCYGSSQTSYVGSGQEICAQAAPGVPAGGGFCPQP
jgi:hypothetical protein